jgi:cytochrome P450
VDWQQVDFFSDESLVEDPYPYFEQLRAACPVQPLPHHGVVAVTGYDEATEVYRDVDTFRSRATTSAASSTATATNCRCTSTWSPWTRPITRRNARC